MRLIDTPEYRALMGMKARCHQPRGRQYANYGGRGIRVCERWLGRGGFERFLADVGRRPSPEHSLDRIDVNGHYEPGNVRWATHLQQQRNKRNTIMVTARGETRSLADWADHLGVSLSTLRGRIDDGWAPEDAVCVPVGQRRPDGRRRRHLTADQAIVVRQLRAAGVSTVELAKRFGVTAGQISKIALGRAWSRLPANDTEGQSDVG